MSALRWTLLFASACGLLAGACRPASAPAVPGPEARALGMRGGAAPATGGEGGGLTVTGVGVVRARPDQAVVVLGVETNGEQLATALEENNRRAAAVREALQAHGVAEADLQTAAFQIQIEEPRDLQTGRRTGPPIYHVTHIYRALFRDLDRVGAGVDAAVAAGANRVDQVAFQVGDADRRAMEARRLAAEEAKARAQALAGALGASLGRVLAVREGPIVVPVPAPVFRAAAAEAGPVPVAAGELEIRVEVEVTWELR